MKKHIVFIMSCVLLLQSSFAVSYHYLYAPWRTDYILNTGHKPVVSYEKADCVFCKQIESRDDDVYFILHRYKHHVIILNKYPYNTGHLLIIPYEHAAHLDDLTSEVRFELMELTMHSVELLKKVLDAHAVNVGINLGRAAGAGIPAHLHVHLVPRWEGDTGFLDTCAQTKLVPVDLQKVYEQLKPYFASINI